MTGTIGGWTVVSGTGDYAGIRGGGHIVGTAFDGGIDDHYTGKLTNSSVGFACRGSRMTIAVSRDRKAA